ncbi:ornithine cyclodeaminase [Acrocarpospora pleiomorpha]|uniref:Ornithine cyclodeaminase n=1 Tax=Acrocarpospora pleiomorpha TaxID=90975 RepID=A0A5M3XHL0_9ACTN|nr:ornithine cyclodeaminase family protein [Acrocarpospora pleiomorpha]GES19151.1 ornithine cyclodeaminase [Acrocarpospora pleiomorpha]
MSALPHVDSDRLAELLPWPTVIGALERALTSPLADSEITSRVSVPLAHGELLLMPAATGESLGVKIVGVAHNPGPDLPRIQALYVLLDGATLTPVAVLDGTALTTLRTAGQSALVVRQMARPEAHKLVVFGAGPQARAHIEALRTVRPIDSVLVVGRRQAPVELLCAQLKSIGVDVRPGTPGDVATADIVVCATNSPTPVFDGHDLAADTCVVAVGSHTPDARELDDTVITRASRIVVEHRKTALREAGDIVQAIANGVLHQGRLTDLSDLGARTPGISVFKSVGMGWQDLAVAQAAWQAELRTLA